jgi:hypothetical protein
MPVTLTIRDEVNTGRPVGSVTLEGLPERITLRDLIRARVREEVEMRNADPGRAMRTLVEPTNAEVTLNGSKLREPKWTDWEAQAEIAEEAFRSNGFFVLVGGRQVTDIDHELTLTPQTDVRFLKLMPLVGG